MCLEDQTATTVGTMESFTSVLGKTCMSSTIRSILRQANSEKRLTVGLLPSIQRLSVTCGEALFCLMAPSRQQDPATHMQKVLLEAFCLENEIYLVKVDSGDKLRKLLPGHNDYSCVLVHLPYPDPYTDQSQLNQENFSPPEKRLIDHCEKTLNNNPNPVIRLPEE